MNANSISTVTIDKAGRLVLPKPMRDALHLKPGDTLRIQKEGDAITLRPPRPAAELVKKNGMWVLKCGEPLNISAVDLIARDREDRIETLIRRSMGEEESE
ncbi:MAG: AbrB/MazE/SpoVT family DNA-binding domain-containing protein [Silvibacterium sp.]